MGWIDNDKIRFVEPRYLHKNFAITGVAKTLDSLVWSIRGVFKGLVLIDVKGADRVIHPVKVDLDSYRRGDDTSEWYCLKVQQLSYPDL